MTLEQLRIFIAVAEKQHVTQAARVLNLTQSATSAAIAALETRYGIKLFDRVGRGIVLTQTGRDFLNEAREVVARAKAAAQVLDDLAGLKRGSLSLAASQTVANYWLPPRIEAFRKAHPGIDLHVTIANTEQVAQAVNRGSADLGFVEGEVDDPALAIRRIEGDSLAVVVGASHPWIGKTRITPKHLAETPWILREPGSGTRSMFEAALKKFGIKLSDLDIRLELPSALPWNPETAPLRFRIWSCCSHWLRERFTASRSTCPSARFSLCGTRSVMRARRKEPCLLPSGLKRK